MGFLKRLKVERLVVGVLIGGGLLAQPGVGLAQAKTKAPLPTPMVERTPSNVEIVNKALNPGASDPNVPLPRAGLSDASGHEPSTAGSSGPRIFGRGEDGGAVLGLRVPIPADRNASGATARYGTGQPSPEPGNEARER
jgi:hypothetical protein